MEERRGRVLVPREVGEARRLSEKEKMEKEEILKNMHLRGLRERMKRAKLGSSRGMASQASYFCRNWECK